MTQTRERTPILLADDFNRSHFDLFPTKEKTSTATHNFATWLYSRSEEAGLINMIENKPVNDPKVKDLLTILSAIYICD